MPTLLSHLATIPLFAGLVLSTTMPEVANVAAIACMVAGLGLVFIDAKARQVAAGPPFQLLYVAGLILLTALIPTAKSLEHLAAILILVPLWLAGPYAGLIAKAPARLLSPFWLGCMAAAGTLGAVLIAAYDVVFLQMRRGGFSVNNPIHLADLAVALGFLALVGLFSGHRWRFFFLLGPALALVAVLLSGSRGPLLALLVLSVLATIYYIIMIWRPSRATLLVVGLALAVAVMVAPFISFELGSGRQLRLVSLAQSVLSGEAADGSTNERLYMLRSAWGAFQASPIYGHGLIDYTVSAAQFGPQDNPYRPSSHLHNDIADFAVIGGLTGLICYLLVLIAPLYGARRAGAEQRPLLMFIALMASAGYLVMGLTNAMMGVLTQTVLYGLMLALIGVLAREERA
ncbi:O-antigen ligase family protein [Devosia sp. XJ19-1]|uniref:O-antigen ligase family protein n=1 Tax=Devosia ureilytica TaxID=2952754 RepID=A0A9Q4FRR4_9HYPH|nr:O-antigen ligase family protein [Devosia ureilytica]MCP8883169.1 O-antigen ligase family protein [Devosia ureilytica]MCP8886463.1 O-antigen ligase family protein [Devosia ureilytica]